MSEITPQKGSLVSYTRPGYIELGGMSIVVELLCCKPYLPMP